MSGRCSSPNRALNRSRRARIYGCTDMPPCGSSSRCLAGIRNLTVPTADNKRDSGSGGCLCKAVYTSTVSFCAPCFKMSCSRNKTALLCVTEHLPCVFCGTFSAVRTWGMLKDVFDFKDSLEEGAGEHLHLLWYTRERCDSTAGTKGYLS